MIDRYVIYTFQTDHENEMQIENEDRSNIVQDSLSNL